jgi:dynein heavy chain
MLFANASVVKNLNDLVRLYLHESERVYCDKFVDKEDVVLFFKLQKAAVKKTLEVEKNIH